MQEVYVSTCCGALFLPGYGPDDIVEADHAFSDATRADGAECPSCGTAPTWLAEVTEKLASAFASQRYARYERRHFQFGPGPSTDADGPGTSFPDAWRPQNLDADLDIAEAEFTFPDEDDG